MRELIFLINCPQEYLSHTDFECSPEEANHFFMTISEVFLPLLKMFAKLEKDNVPYRLALVLPSATLTMLEDPFVQSKFIDYLNKRIEFGKECLTYCEEYTRDAILHQIEKTRETLSLFTKEYNGRLLPIFAEYRQRGTVELLATCGTGIFLPHYIDMIETCSAQIETGLYAYKTFFGDAADGFFLPEMGYASGLEQILKSYGVRYTVLDSRAILFSEDAAPFGIFSPVLCGGDNLYTSYTSHTSLAVFARDNRLNSELFGESGYALKGDYCDTEKDAVFIMPDKNISSFISERSARYPSLYRYLCRNGKAYDIQSARETARRDAALFVKKRIDLFDSVQSLIPSISPSVTCAIDADDFMNKWSEGIYWLECVFRAAINHNLSFASFKEVLYSTKHFDTIRPYFSAAFPSGYGENLINGTNSWMLPPVRRASARMTILAERFSDGSTLKSRLLNLGAKELLLSQSVAWEKRIDAQPKDEYAAKQFMAFISAFNTVFEDLGSNTVVPSWLTALENEHQIFPWMNYKVFCKKR